MYKSILMTAVLLIAFACQQEKPESNPIAQEKWTALDKSLTDNLNKAYQKDSIMGFSVAVVNEEGLIYENGFGYGDLDSAKVYTANTVQPIASISKVLIGISLIKAEELGLLNLKDPISKYLEFKVSNPAHPDSEILIEHLAYHTSSIIDTEEIYYDQYFFETGPDKDNDRETYYNIFRKPEEKPSLEAYLKASFAENGKYEKLPYSDNQPGMERDYSNLGADLCAFIIGKAANMDFRDFTKKYITAPLKMDASSWSLPDVEDPNQSRLFLHKEMRLSRYVPSCYPNGWFNTSSHDLSLLLVELINGYHGNGSLLTKLGYAHLFAKQTYGERTYGCFLEYRDGWLEISDSLIGHNGSDFGVFTGMYFNPERKTGKIMLSNTDTDYFDEEYIWEEIKMVWKSLVDYETELLDQNME